MPVELIGLISPDTVISLTVPIMELALLVVVTGWHAALVWACTRTCAHQRVQLAPLLFKLLSPDQLKQKDRRPCLAVTTPPAPGPSHHGA